MPPTVRERLSAGLVGQYRIEGEVGAGGMATVFLAEDLKHSRKVAIKVLKLEIAASLGVERFIAEVATTASLQHAHILPLFDSGTADGLPYYVMPFVEGESLAQRLRREGQLSIEDSLDIVKQVASALAYAHAHGVVHRDIKPDNILLSSGEAVVADFGIARALNLSAGTSATRTGFALGTPEYMSPEQSLAAPVLDGRTDIYALGAVLYECLAGERPYIGNTPAAIIAKRLNEPVPLISTLRDTVSPALEAAITKALARSPADRFPTVEEFAAALTKTRTGAGTSARTTVGTVQAPAAFRLPSRRTALAAGTTIVLGAGAWLAIRSWLAPPSGVKRIAILPLENLLGDSTKEYFVAGLHEALIGEVGRLGAVDVISRQSVIRYQKSTLSLSEIARELHVDALVTGTVSGSGDSVRIQATMTVVRPLERIIWTGAHDAQISDVLALHSEVAAAIARSIQVRLTPEQEARLTDARSVDPVAYEAYLRGRFFWNRRDAEGLKLAVQYFRDALQRAPLFAPAHAGLADVYLALAINAYGSRDNLAGAVSEAEEALRLDSRLAEAHATLGWAWTNQFDWTRGRQSLETALRLNDRYAPAHQWYGQHLLYTLHTRDGIKELRRAEELDPFSFPVVGALGMGLYYAREYPEAIETLRRANELVPTYVPTLRYLMAAQFEAGRPSEAAATLARMTMVPGAAMMVAAGKVKVALVAGQRPDAEAALKELLDVTGQGTTPMSKLTIATAQFALDRMDEGTQWLEASFAAGESSIVFLQVAPELDKVRTDPRVQDVIRRVGFPR